MLLPSPKAAQSPAKKLLDFARSVNARLRSVLITRPVRCTAGNICFCHHSLAGLQTLEARLLLYGNPVANNDSYVMPYYAGAQINAPGVLANDTDPNPGAQMYARLISGPSHASTFGLNPDGSFRYATYNSFLGTDSFTYYVQDNFGYTSNTATVTLNVEYSVQSTTDLTKQVAINPLDTGLQILGSNSGAPATAQNLSLVSPLPK